MTYPDRVGRFVLDGAIDPTAGDPAGELAADGVPDYAGDEVDDVIERFHELCDATSLCAAGPDSEALVDDLERHDPRPADRRLPRRSVADEPHRPRGRDDRHHLRPVVVGPRRRRPARRRRRATPRRSPRWRATSSRATRSRTCRARTNRSPTSAPRTSPSTAPTSATSTGVWGCDGMPAADPLPVITAVDVAEPIARHRHGSTIRPRPAATPTRWPARSATPSAITWEGVGHTAFPVTECLDGAVVDYLVDGVVPRRRDGVPVRRRDDDRRRDRRPPLRLPVVVGAAVAGGRAGRRGRRRDAAVPGPGADRRRPPRADPPAPRRAVDGRRRRPGGRRRRPADAVLSFDARPDRADLEGQNGAQRA